MPDHNIEVIDLGLTVPQAIDDGLETEQFTRKVALPTGLVLDEDADEWFTGEPFDAGNGKTHYDCNRCELNAFSSDELAEFIEDGLARHLEERGIPAKSITCRGAHRARRRDPRQETRRACLGKIMAMFDARRIVDQVVSDNPGLTDNIGEAPGAGVARRQAHLVLAVFGGSAHGR